jgi:hypothetical protein
LRIRDTATSNEEERGRDGRQRTGRYETLTDFDSPRFTKSSGNQQADAKRQRGAGRDDEAELWRTEHDISHGDTSVDSHCKPYAPFTAPDRAMSSRPASALPR